MVTKLFIRNYDPWRRLYARYGLEPSQPLGTQPELATVVVPVTQADELLKRYVASTGITAVTGNDIVTIYTVPQGERWTFTSMNILLSSGTFDTQGLRFFDASENVEIQPFNYTATTTQLVPQDVLPVTLDELDEVRVQVANFAVGGNQAIMAWRAVENAF